MAIQGLRLTTNFATDERPKDWREVILRQYPNGKAPLTALTTAMKTRTVTDPEFHWWEKAMEERRVALGANITSSETVLTVVSGAFTLKRGDVLYVEQTAEIVRVANDPVADTAITVQRGFAGSTATAVTYAGAGVNPNLKVIGSAYEEASMPPPGVNFDPNKRTNYTQIFRNTLEASRTAMNTRLRTGSQVKEAKRETLELHSIDMEMAFWLGRASESALSGKPIRTTGGVISFIPSANIKTVAGAGALDMETFEEYMYGIFQYGSNEKMAFAGNRALLAMQQVVRRNTQFTFTNDKEFGMNVTRFTSPFGTIVFKTHPLFNTMRGGTTGGTAYYSMESWAVILDMSNLQYCPLQGGDTKYQADLQANGMDGMLSGYLTEAGMEVDHANTHYLIKNMVSGAADT